MVKKILSSPNRTNRSNRQVSTQVPEYREIFTSVANEMQMSYSKLYLSDRPKNSQYIRQIERIGQMKLLFFPIESCWQYWTTLLHFIDRSGYSLSAIAMSFHHFKTISFFFPANRS